MSIVVKKTMFGNEPKKSAAQYRAEIQQEINMCKVDINKMTFHKTDEERRKLKKIQLQYNKDKNRHFAISGREELVKQILNSRVPRWDANSRVIVK